MAADPVFDPDMRGESQTRRVDRVIQAIAARQHGAVARRQLLAVGIGGKAIDRRIASGWLIVVARGVYVVGHPRLVPEARRLIAVLAAGPDAVLFGRTAGAHWGLRPDTRPVIEVATPRALRSSDGVVRHQVRLAGDEVTVADDVPVTTVARTLLDLAAVLDEHRLRRAFAEAERRRLGDRVPLPELLRRHPHTPGAARLRSILSADALDAAATESELEIDFVVFAAAHGLPALEENHPVGPFRVDAAWPQARVAVELDSRAFHLDARSFEEDRRRDRILATLGWVVVRVTARQLRDEPDAIAADLRRLLSARTP